MPWHLACAGPISTPPPPPVAAIRPRPRPARCGWLCCPTMVPPGSSSPGTGLRSPGNRTRFRSRRGRVTTNRVCGPLGDAVRKLPDRVWKRPRHEDDEGGDEDIGRILALSDGVFAIAVTLLILDIAVPATTSDDALPKVLLGLWPRYLAYALSFLVIARFWVIHHGSFQLIVRYDDALVWLNLLLLLFVAFLPFPTA